MLNLFTIHTSAEIPFYTFSGSLRFGFLFGVSNTEATLYFIDANTNGEGFVMVGAVFFENMIGRNGGVIMLR